MLFCHKSNTSHSDGPLGGLLKQTENQMPCGPIKPAGNECLLDFLPIKKKKKKNQVNGHLWRKQ